MTEHVYSSSIFWSVITGLSKFAGAVAIPLLAITVFVWAAKSRTVTSAIGGVGALLVAGGHMSHYIFPGVITIALGGMQPAVGENGIVVFFYLHSINFGLLIMASALLFALVRNGRFIA